MIEHYEKEIKIAIYVMNFEGKMSQILDVIPKNDVYILAKEIDFFLNCVVRKKFIEKIRKKILEHLSKWNTLGYNFEFVPHFNYDFDNVRWSEIIIKVIEPERMIMQLEESENEFDKCTVCRQYKKNYVTNCGHLYCAMCVDKINTCAICSTKIVRKQQVYL